MWDRTLLLLVFSIALVSAKIYDETFLMKACRNQCQGRYENETGLKRAVLEYMYLPCMKKCILGGRGKKVCPDGTVAKACECPKGCHDRYK